MIMVLLNWLYIAITTFITGYAVLGFFSALFDEKVKKATLYCLAGLAVNTVYAQFFSLFSKVGVAANVVLIALCLLIVVIKRKEMSKYLKEWYVTLAETKYQKYVYLGIILLVAFGTSRGFIHYDTSLYHAQSIRWIEEYKVIPGLATLQQRFGYNSSAFALTALYSFKALIGQSLHTTAGFFVLLAAFEMVEVKSVFLEGKVRMSDFIRIGLLFYLGLIYTEMISPASDYYAQILIFLTLIYWFDADESKTTNAFPYAMLSILLVYAATVKFSIALLVLLVIKPAVMMIKNKQTKQILCSLGAGIITLLPFFIRNIYISGWLVYPSTIIDIANVDWKIPKGMAQYDAAEIGVYGKGINDVALKNTPLVQWLKPWFINLSIVEKFWVAMTAVCIVVGIIYFMYKAIKKTIDLSKLLVFVVVIASGCVWFFGAPLVRYGYGYLTCIPLIVDGMLCMELVKKTGDMRALKLAYFMIFALVGLYRIKTVGYQIVTTASQPYYFEQKDYTNWPATEYNLGGYTFYKSDVADQIGYESFPAANIVIDVELRGDDITDGFRYADYEGFSEGWENGYKKETTNE